MADKPKQIAKPARVKYEDEFTVLVGSQEERFMVHASVLTTPSKFFRKACSGEFKEGKEKTIRLPEACVDSFQAYLQWIYSGDVVVLAPEEYLADTDGAKQRLALGQLCGLADVLMDVPLQNATVDDSMAACRSTSIEPGVDIITWTYAHTTEQSTLRRFVLDWHINASGECADWLAKNKDDLPAAFFVDLTISLAKANWVNTADPYDAERCHYHEHNDDIPKCIAEGKSDALTAVPMQRGGRRRRWLPGTWGMDHTGAELPVVYVLRRMGRTLT